MRPDSPPPKPGDRFQMVDVVTGRTVTVECVAVEGDDPILRLVPQQQGVTQPDD